MTDYDNNNYMTRTTTTVQDRKNKKMWTWVAGIAVVLAIIAVMGMPDRTTTGDSLTTGTPPASTMPSDRPSATDPGVPTPGTPSTAPLPPAD